jgi:hypothetical protein
MQKYKFTHPLYDLTEATFEVNWDSVSKILEEGFDVMSAVNEFFSGKEVRKDVFGNLAGLSLIASYVLARVVSGESFYSIRREFDSGEVEGMPPLDGTYGITLVSCSSPEIDAEDLEMETVV